MLPFVVASMLFLASRPMVVSSRYPCSFRSVRTRSLAIRFLASASMLLSSSATEKRLTIVRHGQAQHNPRAEAARAAGGSLEEFFRLMREDDVLDARLTDEGEAQAAAAALASSEAASIDLVVGSSLSRALATADFVLPPTSSGGPPRVCHEFFREVHGDMLNAKRRTKTELEQDFPHWNFGELSTDEDTLWTPNMESFDDAAERGYLGLKWLLEERPEKDILLVSHGGLLRYAMNQHPLVSLADERKGGGGSKTVESRFDNCERRCYRLGWAPVTSGAADDECPAAATVPDRRPILLTQVDDDEKEEEEA